MSDFRPFSDEKLDQFIASGQLKHEKDEAIAERQRRQTDRAEKQAQERHKTLIETISLQTATPKIDWPKIGAWTGLAAFIAMILIYLLSYFLSR